MEPAQRHEAPEETGGTRTALLLDNDLFFSVKIADTLRHAGFQTRTVRTSDAFAAALAADRPAIALVNTGGRGLDWRAGVRTAQAAGVPVVAFGSHVDLATQEEARALGATSVIANSKLAGDLATVVERAIRRGARSGAGAPAAGPLEGVERGADDQGEQSD